MIPNSEPFQERLRKHRETLNALESARSNWFAHWRELADYFLPRRYPALMSEREAQDRSRNYVNRKLLDGTSIIALRTLASGMMNGITSPARPWFKLGNSAMKKLPPDSPAAAWLSECREIMTQVFAESNFYNSVATLYFEWACFGTGGMTIEEDYDDVIRCTNMPIGEFFLDTDNTGRVSRVGRKFFMRLENMVEEFGLSELPEQLRLKFEQGGVARSTPYKVFYLAERNEEDAPGRLVQSPWRELYWVLDGNTSTYLAVRPLWSWKHITPRWEVLADDAYGTSPTMDALGDVKQLQDVVLKKAQGLGKMVRPPVIADMQLKNRATAFAEGGITWAPNYNANFGAKALMDLRMPFQELMSVEEELRTRIREFLHNNLFNMISQLETVRSATEIDARREEKLVHLSPVLERFYDEGLKPITKRVFDLCQRNGLFPEPPEEISGMEIDVEFKSILSDAQRASDTVAIERFFAFTGNLAGVYPEVAFIADSDFLIRQYAEALGVDPRGLKTIEQVEQRKAQEAESQQLAQQAAVGKDFAQGAAALGGVEVGGGRNAVQSLMGL